MGKIGAGSGVDTKSLATNLVEAERAPQKALLDKKIANSEAKISGFAAMQFVVGQVKDAFSAVNDQTDFTGLTTKNSNTTAFGVSTTAKAAAGDHQVKVVTLAKPQLSLSGGFATTSASLNSGNAMTLTLTAGSTTQTLSLDSSEATPMGIVDEINSNTSTSGVSAQLINTGDATDPYKILLTGTTGSANTFTLTATDTSSGVAVSDFAMDPAITDLSGTRAAGVPLQVATNATAIINGITISRTTNKIESVIKGVTFDLYTTTDTAASVNLTRDTTSLKEKLTALVTAYNDANDMFKVITSADSEVETYGGTLVNDSSVRIVRDQLRSMFTGVSSTPGTTISQMWQLGVSIDSVGKMSLDSDKLDTVVADNYDDVVTMMTGNLSNLSSFSTQSAGLAGDAVRKLTTLMSSTGIISTQSKAASEKEVKYKADLEKLETRLAMLLVRYTKQFAAMDALVGQTNSLKTSLTSTFDAMNNSNN
jgi:flagellar hook-associated protein 2